MWVPLTTTWRVLVFRMEETASRYGRYLRIYWIGSRRRPTRGDPSDWGLDEVLTTSYWLRIGISCGPLWTRYWTFRFHKRLGSSWLAVWRSASQEGLCFMELVSKLQKMVKPLFMNFMRLSTWNIWNLVSTPAWPKCWYLKHMFPYVAGVPLIFVKHGDQVLMLLPQNESRT
jgi:hypothetical protein